jgi:hypothetical protein
MQSVIEKLKDDNEYYSGIGKAYLSNSDIGDLLKNPRMFKQEQETTTAMAIGSYFHKLVLEPEKAKECLIVYSSTRTTNIYKDATNGGKVIGILNKEAEEAESMKDALMGNMDFYNLIYADGNQYEVPSVGELFGLPWKGKADIVGAKCLYDIKTTTNIDKFKWSAKEYNYDSQAYIYGELFKKPLVFLVIEKVTNRMGMFTPSEDFLSMGKQKVLEAMTVYERFFGENKTDDVDQYYMNEIL